MFVFVLEYAFMHTFHMLDLQDCTSGDTKRLHKQIAIKKWKQLQLRTHEGVNILTGIQINQSEMLLFGGGTAMTFRFDLDFDDENGKKVQSLELHQERLKSSIGRCPQDRIQQIGDEFYITSFVNVPS